MELSSKLSSAYSSEDCCSSLNLLSPKLFSANSSEDCCSSLNLPPPWLAIKGQLMSTLDQMDQLPFLSSQPWCSLQTVRSPLRTMMIDLPTSSHLTNTARTKGKDRLYRDKSGKRKKLPRINEATVTSIVIRELALIRGCLGSIRTRSHEKKQQKNPHVSLLSLAVRYLGSCFR